MLRPFVLLLLVSSSLVLVGSCGDSTSDPTKDMVETSLLSQGMPLVVLTPPNPIISKRDMRVQREVSIRKGKGFAVDVYESAAPTRDLAAIKSRLLFEIQGNPYFQKVIEDGDQGFIYQTAIDSSYINYGFRYFLVQGDNEYVFQSGLGTKFTEEEVRTMYDAVRLSPN